MFTKVQVAVTVGIIVAVILVMSFAFAGTVVYHHTTEWQQLDPTGQSRSRVTWLTVDNKLCAKLETNDDGFWVVHSDDWDTGFIFGTMSDGIRWVRGNKCKP